MAKIITRFPPSPTGLFHVGSARTALFNYLFAKQHDGEFLLRFEDTDRERSKPAFETDILEGLSWLGLTPDNEPLRQSERLPVYRKHLEQLLESDSAYEAEDSQDSSGKVIRFKNPNREVVFDDIVRGEVRFDTSDLGDFVIAKGLDEPLYHLAVVVDDREMGITHVIRGEDHISNTPRQILLQEALGFDRPLYAHLPLILGTDRSKLSKRHGTVSVNAYREEGFVPEAFVNFLSLLGWHPEGDEEKLSLKELVAQFDLSRVQKGGAVFDESKLRWLNKCYLSDWSDDQWLAFLQERLPEKDIALLTHLIPLVRERAETLGDIETRISEGELDFFFTAPSFDLADLNWKETETATTRAHLQRTHDILEELPENIFNKESIKEALWNYASEEGRGAVLWPLRFVLSGREHSPDPFSIAEILGKEEVLARLTNALVLSQ